MSEPIELSWNI